MNMTTPAEKFRTGGDIDAFCTKCDLTLTHTIIAMVGTKVVKVKCNTCGADHSYRGEKAQAKRAGVVQPKKALPRWEDRIKDRNVEAAKKYSPKDLYKIDDLINHTLFGLGLVTANRSGKIDVAFKTFEKTLICGKRS